jgi:hypothetical protein
LKQIIDWTTKRIWASITDEELYNTQNAFNMIENSGISLEYILGIINSKLMAFYHRKNYLDEFKMRFQKILIKDCKRLPIRKIDFSNSSDKIYHDKIEESVKYIMLLQKQLESVRLLQEKNNYEHINVNDREIDRLIYKIYGLNDDDIAVVEKAVE